jgi:tetratricopeptide (TPR) repeat protein
MTSPTSPARPARVARSLWLLGLSLACILLGVIGAAAYAGYQAGLSEHETQARATQAVELQLQYDLGVADLAAGRYELAAERFTYIVQRDPNYPGAAEKLAEARQAMQITPSVATSPPPTPSADPAEIFALAERYYAENNWDGVITQVALLHTLDPNYEALQADQLLFEALRHRGVERIQGDAMEAGISDLNQAEAYGPLDAEAANLRLWATYYLAAQSYWGVNWEQTVGILQELHLLAPNFRDTSSKLYQATLNYAAQLSAAGDACGAAAQYANAQALLADPGVAEAQATAQANCLLTPTATPTFDLPLTPPAVDVTPTP